MNGTPGMFGQQQQQMLPPNLQQQVLLQQLQQQQLLQQQQRPAAPLQAPAAAAVPNYGAAVAQMQARLAQQAAIQQVLPGLAGQPLAVQLPPGAAAAAAVQATPAAAAFAPQQAAAAAATPAAAAAAGTPANAPMSLPPAVPQQAAAPAAAAAGSSAVQAAAAAAAPAAGAQAAAAGAAGDASDPRVEKVGFAKLLGDGLEYYIKKYEIVLGRKSKAAVDVVLGDSPVLSRQHCRIVYNFQTKKWQLVVEGKNGVTVNGVVHTPASGPCNLASQDLLQAGDMSFYFLLPKPPRKPKAKPAATPAAAAGSNAVQQQQPQQSVPGTPVLGAGSSAAAAAAGGAGTGQLQGSSPMLPGFSPRLPQAGAILPGLAAAGAAAGPDGLQPYSSGPLLGGIGGGLFPGVQGYPGGTNLAGSQDMLQPGLGDTMDEGMMDV